MSTPHSGPVAGSSNARHALHTIGDIRAPLPNDQLQHFDAELADTDIADLEDVLTRWAILGHDDFVEFLLSTPFRGLGIGRCVNEAEDHE